MPDFHKLPTIVAFTGYAGHGKDTCADILVNHFGYEKVAFADPLRKMAYAINPIIEIDMIDCIPMHLREIIDDLGWDKAKRQYPEVRRFLQSLGTEGVRATFGDYAWTNLFKIKVNQLIPAKRVTVPDLRFGSEDTCVNYDFPYSLVIVRVINPRITDNGVGTEHASESYISKIKCHFDLINDGTVEDLKIKLIDIMTGLDCG